MRIAVANWTRRRAGGVETYVEQVLAAFAAEGHETSYWYEIDRPESAGAIVMPATTGSLPLGDGDAVLAWRPDLIVVNELLDEALESRLLSATPSVFVAHSFAGTCVSGSKAWSAPVVQPCSRRLGPGCLVHYFPHRCGGRNPLTMVSMYRRAGRRLASFSRATRIVTLSSYMRDEYRRHGFADHQVSCVPYGPPRTGTVPRRTAAARPASLIFIGRLERLKGVHVLLDALPDAAAHLGWALSLAVIGDGPERRPLEAQATAVMRDHPDVSIRFEGRLAAEERDRCLERADLLVVPSLWPEPFGLVGLEAARVGVPAVAFDVGGIRQWLVPGETGVLAQAAPPTSGSLATALVAALRDGDALHRMGMRAGALAAAGPTPLSHASALLALMSASAQPH